MAVSSLLAEVAIAAPIDKSLTYLVPDDLLDQVQVGCRLEVPLGRRRAVGFLLALSTASPPGGTKAIYRCLDEVPLFPLAMVEFFRRAAAYYCHPIGQVIATALPAGLSGRGTAPSLLQEKYYRFGSREDQPRGQVQRNLLAYVRSRPEVALTELRQQFDAPHAPLARLVDQGWLLCEERERLRDPFLNWPVEPAVIPLLSGSQQEALARIEADSGAGFVPYLLHGVTGSGKTEVYLQAIAATLKRGRQALVLVPEIALTPQLVARFRSRFQGQTTIAVLHSGLSDGERYDAWRQIARGEVQIVIGARSALFAPLDNLGIVVIDEEHEPSYKQSEGFRYSGRDLALLRGQLCRAQVLLGSATPSLGSWQRANQGQATLLQLPQRIAGRPLPVVHLVDMAEEEYGQRLSTRLQEAIAATLERNEQVLLLLNRRGFSPFLLCTDCGHSPRCPNCDITLSYHRGQRLLRCHYCDFSLVPPDSCPDCRGSSLEPEGVGTERLEEELIELFPEARLARLDRDTTSRKGAHRQILEAVAKGEVDILLGTQMVAKGHDFAAVTLVGVLNADASLNVPDFRSAERTFALLTQVAGRAGRGERLGEVYIQTYSADHFALQAAAGHDFTTFAEQELVQRELLGYPPFGHLVNLVLSGNDPDKVATAAIGLSERLGLALGEVELLGPAPCPLARLRGKSRIQILLKAANRAPLRRLLAYLQALSRPVPAGVGLSIDVDPLEMS